MEKRAAEDEMVGGHHLLNGMNLSKSRREWRTEEPGVLQSMGSQRVGDNLGTEQQQQKCQLHFSSSESKHCHVLKLVLNT